jgi:hypothetical protein
MLTLSTLVFCTAGTKRTNHLKTWEKTNVANLLRHGQSGRYYARFVTQSKQVWRSLKTEVYSVAKLRRPDEVKKIRRAPGVSSAVESGCFTVDDAMAVYPARARRRAPTYSRRKCKSCGMEPS